MSVGMPMPESEARIIREMVERAAGPEIVAAIRESARGTHEIVEHMSPEEFANWILGIEP